MFLAIFLLFFTLCLIAKLRKTKSKKEMIRAEGAKINLLLQNVEVYDGSGRGQKRLEDNK